MSPYFCRAVWNHAAEFLHGRRNHCSNLWQQFPRWRGLPMQVWEPACELRCEGLLDCAELHRTPRYRERQTLSHHLSASTGGQVAVRVLYNGVSYSSDNVTFLYYSTEHSSRQ